MKKILVLGATGHLGKILVNMLLNKNYIVVALVRNTKKLDIKHKNLRIIQGDVTDSNDLLNALSNINVVISVLGHGFRTRFPIQEKTMNSLFPLMEKNKINRFITITGAGLKIKGDPNSFIADFSEKLFYLVDRYRMQDAKNQQQLIEKTNLDWTVVRTPIHNNKNNETVVQSGFTQPPLWKTVSRFTISKFIIDCIENNLWIKKAPIIY
jgi:putative NADH-flavin reductase